MLDVGRWTVGEETAALQVVEVAKVCFVES